MFSNLWNKIWSSHILPETDLSALKSDMHSHLVPGIDDGVKSTEEALELIQALYAQGISTVVTTPHIMQEGYPNTPATIQKGAEKVKKALQEHHIPVNFDAAAEYYVDEFFEQEVRSGAPLLTFGRKYILIELSYLNKPHNLNEIIFALQTRDLVPVLAHPERYTYLYEERKALGAYRELREQDVQLQVNLLSFGGAYPGKAKDIAEEMADQQMIDWLGTDIHRPTQIPKLRQALKNKRVHQLLQAGKLHNMHLHEIQKTARNAN